MVQRGPSGYRSGEGIMDQVSEFGARAETMAEELALPSSSARIQRSRLLLVSHLQSVLSGSSVIGSRRPASKALRARMPDMRRRMPELPNSEGLMPHSWR